MNVMKIGLKVLNPNLDASQLQYQTTGSSGVDLLSMEEESLKPGERILIPCGFSLEIPYGYEAQIRPRSGLAYKHGITVLNTPGTIDADYRGEIKVLLIHLGTEPFSIQVGDRIAQMVIVPVVLADFVPSHSLSSTGRGAGGFGHTGVET